MAAEYLLDTSVYSQRLRPAPVPEVVRRWRLRGDACLAVSVICEAELLYGLEKRQSERLWREYRNCLKDRLLCIPVDLPVARVYGDLRARLASRGSPRADFDLLIAATALAHNLRLATLNIRHFEDIPGLIVEDWSIVG